MGNRFVKNRIKQYNNIRDPLEVPYYSFNGETDLCWVTKCYDGDTIHIIRIINKVPYRLRCRLYGIDTAELRSADPDERRFAEKTKEWLLSRIYNQYVWVSFGGFGKYGRTLCTIYTSKKEFKSKKSVNQQMIDLGYALPYDGGKKQPISVLFKEKHDL